MSLALAEASSSIYYLVVSEQYLVKALIEASSIVRSVPGDDLGACRDRGIDLVYYSRQNRLT